MLISAEYTETVFRVNTPSPLNYTVADIPSRNDPRDCPGMDFTANLRRYRAQRELGQSDLAERVGVAQATVQRWESGNREPKHSDLDKLADALGVRVSDLFRSQDEVDAPTVEQLASMIGLAMRELPVGVTYADYPHAVAASLHAQLELFRAAGGFQGDQDGLIGPDIAAQSHGSTIGDETAELRIR